MFTEDELPILGILRGIDKKDVKPLTDIFIRNKVKNIEITMNTDGVEELIAAMLEYANGELVVGAGTVLNTKEMHLALKAGAQFIVSPTIVDEVIAYCASNKTPVFPGALTPTEVHRAWDMGASMVKLFPASLFGPSYIKALKGPLDKIKVMAVGGISDSNISEYFAQGADAVAFGASIVQPKLLEKNDFAKIELNLRSFINRYLKRKHI